MNTDTITPRVADANEARFADQVRRAVELAADVRAARDTIRPHERNFSPDLQAHWNRFDSLLQGILNGLHDAGIEHTGQERRD